MEWSQLGRTERGISRRSWRNEVDGSMPCTGLEETLRELESPIEGRETALVGATASTGMVV